MDRDSSSKTVEDCVKASAAADSSFNFEGALGWVGAPCLRGTVTTQSKNILGYNIVVKTTEHGCKTCTGDVARSSIKYK